MRIDYVISLIAIHFGDQHHNMAKKNQQAIKPMSMTRQSEQAFKDFKES